MRGAGKQRSRPYSFMNDYEQHEIGKCYPPLSSDARNKLRANLQGGGPKSAVCLFEGKILDGWHQYLICREDGLACAFEEVNPADPTAFVVQRNEGRRHLTDDQRAMIAAELAEIKRKSPWRPEKVSNSKPFSPKHKTPELVEAAVQQKVSISKVSRARRAKTIDPACAEKIRNGEMKIAAVVGPLERAGRGKKGGKSQHVFPPKRLEPVRPTGTPFATAEETGFPINGTMAERDAHHRKYGRTPLHPKAIADILKHSEIVTAYVAAITMASSESHPSLEVFFASVDAMEAWVPDSEKGKDWATNFAGKARKELARLKERLPLLLKRLSMLQQILQEREAAI
jgi:hypothetical protein